MSLSWHACELISGLYLGELPIQAAGDITRAIGAATSLDLTLATADLPGVATGVTQASGAVGNWELLTQPAATLVIAVRDSDDAIVWDGVIWGRSHAPGSLVLHCSSTESLFSRRYGATHTDARLNAVAPHLTKDQLYLNNEATFVARRLIEVGVPDLNFTVLTSAGEPSNRIQYLWADSDNKKLADVLGELSAQVNGPEWTCGARWVNGPRSTVEKLVSVTFRLGTTTPDQPAPARIVFDSTQMSAWTLDEDYSDGNGATVVTATSNGSSSGSELSSLDYTDHAAIANGMPILEYRFSPGTSVTLVSTLNGYAQGVYDQIHLGTITATATLESDVAPVVGVDFLLGDYALVRLSDPRWQDTKELVLRIYSYDVDGTGALTPTFYSA